MSTARLYIEGGGAGKDLQIGLKRGLGKLLENSGFRGRMPRLFISGGRTQTFDDFGAAHSQWGAQDYVAMLVDSEEPLANLEASWQHLLARDHRLRPVGAEDEQVLFMTTCMETWIIADRRALAEHYGARLQANALPPLVALEERARGEIQDQLVHATRNCANVYRKGKRSYAILGRLDPTTLAPLLPSFRRVLRILDRKL